MVSYLQISTNNWIKGTFILRLKKYLSLLVTPSNNNNSSNNGNNNNKNKARKINKFGFVVKLWNNIETFISRDLFKKIYLMWLEWLIKN